MTALGELRQLEHRKRGRGRGLEHRAVAGGQHGGQLPSRHKEREVPRHDLTDDADGLVQHERHHVARKHVGLSRIGQQHAGEVTEMIDRVRHVDGARLANGLAVVQRLEQSELLGVLFDEVGHLVQDNSALGLRGLAPGFERLPSSVDRAVDVFLGGIGNNGKLFTVGGAVHVERAAVRRVDPFAADVELIGFLSRVVHGYFLSHECCMPLPAPAFAPSPNAHPAAGDASHARCAAPKAVAMKIHPCASNRRPRCQLFTRTVLFPRIGAPWVTMTEQRTFASGIRKGANVRRENVERGSATYLSVESSRKAALPRQSSRQAPTQPAGSAVARRRAILTSLQQRNRAPPSEPNVVSAAESDTDSQSHRCEARCKGNRRRRDH